ncbi:Kynurenine formamidase [Caprobacter fermentans]|uniref:Cyclase family protein n=1 Tax=Caproicibacter fermentans TaxID=2576756 RepID=A0A6N8HXA1_9FIRM|nr:cyclase family protein [Caproicibacter fermentans]MVB10372.1 Kynurenine formamidase [Caproicibacter fermentans]QNK40405.1 cyclase family protein [Caproicibacter fermentans]
MELIDVTRELFSSQPYPGDPVPRRDIVRRMDLGDACNLSGFYACCHSATHLDAPLHFIPDGDSVDQIDLSLCIGPCTVIAAEGILTGADIDRLAPPQGGRLLLKGGGEAYLTQSAAFALAQSGIVLIGTDAQSIGAPNDEEAPHKELLGAGIPILEGLNLTLAEPGGYRLIAFPLLMSGAEASPVRAVLIRD